MKKNNKAKPINLKLQIVIGFIIPIFIVIFVGVSAYNKAETGLIETYETSTCTSIEMASQLIDFGLKNLTSTAIEISSNSDFLGYVAGTESLDSVQSMNDLKSTLLMKQLSNDFIQNVHVIPNSSSICLSTAKITVFKGEDSYNDICKEFESQCSAIESTKKWGSSHSELDNLFGLNTDDYAGFLCTVSSYQKSL